MLQSLYLLSNSLFIIYNATITIPKLDTYETYHYYFNLKPYREFLFLLKTLKINPSFPKLVNRDRSEVRYNNRINCHRG